MVPRYTSGITGSSEECFHSSINASPKIGITGYNTLTPNSQEEVLAHLTNIGPLAAAVAMRGWMHYTGGVFDGCGYDEHIILSHAVQVVGFGPDYWIVRNSWGVDWGEEGYIRLKRQDEVQCGLNTFPLGGTACEGGPGSSEQKVCGECGILWDLSYPLGAQSI